MYKKKLIEVALPLAKINFESARQKTMGASPHYQNLHRWWARRPSAAARAMLWASLVDDPSSRIDEFPTFEMQSEERKRLFDLFEELLPWSANQNKEVLALAHAEIVKSCEGVLPKVLDPFGGGGAIPLESLRLGVPTFTGDLNPVAVLLQRAMLEIPDRFSNHPAVHPNISGTRTTWDGLDGLSSDVLAYGMWMQEEARRRIGEFYPEVQLHDGSSAVPIAWIWARTVKSPDPSWSGMVPLVRSWELVRKKGRPAIWIDAELDEDNQSFTYNIREGGMPPSGTVGRQGGVCLATGASIPFSYIRAEGQADRLGRELIAIVCEGENGRIYLPPGSQFPPKISRSKPPLGKIPDNPRDFKTPNYGMTNWEDLFTDRQCLALETFSELLKDVQKLIETDAIHFKDDRTPLRNGGSGRRAYAEAITTYLALVIDRCADYWSSICSWHAANQQLRETFARQATPMTWAFAEATPFSVKMGSWQSMLKTNQRAISTLEVGGVAEIRQRDAKARITEVGNCVLSTDPPYYDNIGYSDLSDFFYVWLRRNVKEIWPDECATILTPKTDELIADTYRAGSKVAANRHFELGMEDIFRSAAQNCDERFPATVFYAFKASESEEKGNVSTGWETFLSGLLTSGFSVTATWPIRTEMANKIGVNAGDNMLASSIVLACRKRDSSAAMATRGEFVSALRKEMASAIQILQSENIAPVDLAQSSIGPGIAIFSRYSKILEADGQAMSVRTALSLINEVLSEVISGEESEFDADTRFAVTWFEQFGHNPGPFGDADTLAKAKNTTVAGVVESGVAVSKEGKLRLLERQEISDNWNPTKDSRLTVWETTQHLIRALDRSEIDASELLKQIGSGLGDKARQLAYLLYGICDRKKWAGEGSAYNMLIAAWPEIEKLARQETTGDSLPETLF